MSSTEKVLFLIVGVAALFGEPSSAAIDTFVYGGCAQPKYIPGSPYESNVNSVLSSLVNSATLYTYNNFTVDGSGNPQDTVSGMYQCRGDLSAGSGECASCVARAVSRMGSLCLGACGGALQLEGCFVKYDNVTFLGVEDKTVVVRKCGPPLGYNSDELARRDAVVGYLGASSDGPYRVGVSGEVQGVAQCTGDLSTSECQDCLSEAIGRLKTDCGAGAWADVYLAKCYARFWAHGSHSRATGSGKPFLLRRVQWLMVHGLMFFYPIFDFFTYFPSK